MRLLKLILQYLKSKREKAAHNSYSMDGIKVIGEYRQQEIVKIASWISIVSISLFNTFYILIAFKEFLPAIITNAVNIATSIIALLLVKNKHVNASKYVFFLGLYFSTVVLSYFLFGSKAGVHYFFLLFSLIPVCIWSLNKKIIILSFFVLNLASFNYIEFFHDSSTAIIHYPEPLVLISKIITISACFAYTMYSLWVFFYISERREQKLREQQTELQKVNNYLKINEKEIKRQKENLQELNLQLEKKINELAKVNTTKDKFFSIISHDLKNPLFALVGLSNMLNDRIDVFDIERIKKFTASINSSANNLNTLALNLLDWAKTQLKTIEVKPVNIELRKIITDNIELYHHNAKLKDISFSMHNLEGVFVYADEDMFGTIVRNISNNAVKFTPNGGNITYDTIIENGMVSLLIKDNGIGMTEEQKQKLFKFDKMESTLGTKNETGSGLGLLICKEFVKLNNGSISVESEKEKGSTFKISMPVAKAKI